MSCSKLTKELEAVSKGHPLFFGVGYSHIVDKNRLLSLYVLALLVRQ